MVLLSMTEEQLRELNIDEKILPLIIELNRVGLETMWSCAGHEPEILKYGKIELVNPRPAYIVFNIDKIKGFDTRINKLRDGWGFGIYWDRRLK